MTTFSYHCLLQISWARRMRMEVHNNEFRSERLPCLRSRCSSDREHGILNDRETIEVSMTIAPSKRVSNPGRSKRDPVIPMPHLQPAKSRLDTSLTSPAARDLYVFDATMFCVAGEPKSSFCTLLRPEAETARCSVPTAVPAPISPTEASSSTSQTVKVH